MAVLIGENKMALPTGYFPATLMDSLAWLNWQNF